MAQRLYGLLWQLMDGALQKALRKKFDGDPAKVADALDARARRALYMMNRNLIAAHVGTEIMDDFPENAESLYGAWVVWFANWPFPAGEFTNDTLPPECCSPEGVAPAYPEPDPRVYSIQPASASANSGSVVVDVVGQGFVRGSTRLNLIHANGQELTVTNSECTGTFRCGHVKASVSMPQTPGEYKVRVVVEVGSVDGQPVEVVVPSEVTFTVTA